MSLLYPEEDSALHDLYDWMFEGSRDKVGWYLTIWYLLAAHERDMIRFWTTPCYALGGMTPMGYTLSFENWSLDSDAALFVYIAAEEFVRKGVHE